MVLSKPINATLGRLCSALARLGRWFTGVVEPDHEERATQRARRELHNLFTNTLRVYFWGVLWTAVGIVVTYWLAAGHNPRGQAIVGVAVFLGCASLAVGVPLLGFRVTASGRQRDEARKDLAHLNRDVELDVRAVVRGYSLRVGIRNTGPITIPPGMLLNLRVPKTWTVFYPSDERGERLDVGTVYDTDFVSAGLDDADDEPQKVWVYTTDRPLLSTVRDIYLFRFFAPGGEYRLVSELNGPTDLPFDLTENLDVTVDEL
jgi:hypothetical protein